MMGVFDYGARLDRLRQVMADHRVDVVLVSVGADLPYLCGYEAMPLERLTMLVVDRDSEPTLVVPELEAPRVGSGPFRLRPWSETEDPVAIVADLVGSPETAAIGDQTWSRFLLALQRRFPTTRFVPASPLVGSLRIRKEPAEVEALAAAAAGVDRVLARIPAEVRFSGRSERAVARDIVDMTLEEGHDSASFWIVASGPNGASPHHEPSDRVIGPGDLVVVDFGGRRDGYCSDVTRTFVVGDPSPEAVEVHRVVAAAQEAGREAVRPGVTAEEVDAAARRVIDAAGFGEFFVHRTGHGIGLETHEDPYLVAGNGTVLEAGMAFSVEPGVYLPGRFGVRIEDIVVVTDRGVRVLNGADRSLVAVS